MLGLGEKNVPYWLFSGKVLFSKPTIVIPGTRTGGRELRLNFHHRHHLKCSNTTSAQKWDCRWGGRAGEGPSRLSSRLTHFGGEEKAGVTFVSIYNFTQDSKIWIAKYCRRGISAPVDKTLYKTDWWPVSVAFRGCIFSRVRPLYERAVSDLDP
jgi:hypothetical protein